MKSVASTPLRFIGMVVATNAVVIAVTISGLALLAEKHAKRVAVRLDTLLSTARFEDAAHEMGKAGGLGLLFAGITVVGIVLCLRNARIASAVMLVAAIAGAILSPFTFALPAFFLLNAAAIVFFGRKEIREKIVKSAKAEAAAVEPAAAAEPEPDPPTAPAEPASA
jgi:hypothetical protein